MEIRDFYLNSRLRYSLFGTVVLVIVGVLSWVIPDGWKARLFGSTGVHTIAVLPLLNLSGDANQEYFADGMTEALTTNLAQMESV
jgi:hypothetical protein